MSPEFWAEQLQQYPKTFLSVSAPTPIPMFSQISLEDALNLEGALNKLGFFRKRNWVGLTEEDIEVCTYTETDCPRDREDVILTTQRILKEKNGG
jgi:hypothetical protein